MLSKFEQLLTRIEAKFLSKAAYKEFPVFQVIKKDTDTVETITASQVEAAEYIAELVRADYAKEFSAWCYWAKRDPKDLTVWAEYYLDVLTQEQRDNYIIKKIKIQRSAAVAMVRQACGLRPRGCSYESPAEKELAQIIAEQEAEEAEE